MANSGTGDTVYPAYASVEDMLAALQPSYPVMCFWPERVRDMARTFQRDFPGTVLYAVKCNPHPMVLAAAHSGGIRDFDAASPTEIALVNELFDDATCYFNHPVKGRAAIETSVRRYGVRDFVVDHPDELAKVMEIAGPGVTVEVRLRTPGGVATHDLSAKFGADVEQGAELLRAVVRMGGRPAISFHVGSQCLIPSAYRTALEIVSEVIAKADLAVSYINVGGGFPACGDEQTAPPLDTFFEIIRETAQRLGFFETTRLLCEPGRAMVADAASQLVQVHLRKDGQLYLNDGIFGCLSELLLGGIRPPMRAIRLHGELASEMRPYVLFGPTCDASDVAPHLFELPVDIAEGDWIEIPKMGAYSNSLQSNFNGFGTDTFVAITG